jgi:hypothetical protein
LARQFHGFSERRTARLAHRDLSQKHDARLASRLSRIAGSVTVLTAAWGDGLAVGSAAARPGDLGAWSKRPPRRLSDPPVSRQRVSYETARRDDARFAARIRKFRATRVPLRRGS